MGKQRKSVKTATGKIGKREKARRAKEEEKIKLDREDLAEIPSYLQGDLIARNEFTRVVDAASKIDLWDNLDLSILAIYCKAYSQYIETTKHIDENGYTIIGKDGIEKISPFVTAQNKYVEQILRCSSKLGLATTDRLKLIVPEKDTKENKFNKYIVV